MNKVQPNKLYNFKIDNIRFGTLSRSIVLDLFKDGRVISHFLERQIEEWFPELRFVDERGYDFINIHSGELYDQKSFTKNGLNYAPSKMIGSSRKINYEDAYNHAKKINYICTDVTNFPEVNIIIKQGRDLLKEFNFSIPFKHKDKLFHAV